MPDPSLLLLIPAYNEERRIEPVLREYAQFLGRIIPARFTIIVILNGCRDNTLGVVQRVAKEFPCIIWLDFPAPIGKGGALIEGLKLAKHGDFIGYVDADGATGPQAFLEFAPAHRRRGLRRSARAGCRAACCIRRSRSSASLSAACFHLIVELFFGLRVKDTQCPCKLISSDAVEKIHSTLCIADLAFDVNLLVSLHRAGFKILEVPIEWTDKAGSKVTSSLFRASLTMFLSVLRIRLIYSPFYNWLKPLRPLEGWIYKKLRQPKPLSPADGGKTIIEDGRSRMAQISRAIFYLPFSILRFVPPH